MRLAEETLIKVLATQYVFLETGNVNQLQSLKTMSTKFLCCDQLYDYGNFPRCLVFS